MQKMSFGKIKDGSECFCYELKNHNGAYIRVTDFGATLVSVCVPDYEGKLRDVVLGYDSASDYEENTCFFGAVIGRSGNRIEDSKFIINDTEYHMTANENANNLHSGPDGFDNRIWTVKDWDDAHITFCLNSPDLDQGFPGEFHVEMTYGWNDDNELTFHYEGISDTDTVANMTNHSYFNLNGHDSGEVTNQMLRLDADAFTPVKDSASIPTGEIAPVAGTPFDFTTAKAIGQDMEVENIQLQYTSGFDHNFVIRKSKTGIETFADVYSEESKIGMTAKTDLPGVQFYAGNFIQGSA